MNNRPMLYLAALGVLIVGGVVAVLGGLFDVGGSGGAPGSLSPVRQRVIAAAKKAVGLNATDRTAEFEEFLGGPGESDTMKASMALAPNSSTCQLVARAILRSAGFKHASLFAPYAIGSGLAPLWEYAKSVGAWVEGVPGRVPKPGDIMGGDFPFANSHMWTLTDVDATDVNAPTMHSVDGGVVDGSGHQAVDVRSRKWSARNGQIFDTPNLGNVHHVTGWFDIDKLAAAEGLT